MHDTRIAPILRSQYGLVSRDQVREAGHTDRQIHRRVATGAWVREYPGVYRVASVPLTFRSELLAACIATGGIASHRAAARLHRLDSFHRAAPEVVIAHGRWRAGIRAVLHQTTQADRLGSTLLDGIPVTSLARTVLDLGAVVTKRRQGQAIDQLLRERRVTTEILYRTLIAHARRGRDGCGSFRELLEDRVGEERVPLSDWSRWVGELLADAGMSRPVFEHRVYSAGKFQAQVDLAYPEQMVAIELDSRRWHGDEDAFERDRARWNRIVGADWTLLVFTWKQFVEQPWKLVNQVATALDQRPTTRN